MERDALKVIVVVAATCCAAAPTGVSAQTYQFGNSMFLSTKLRMASFGPMRSEAVDCSTADYSCLKSDFLAIAVPRRCAGNAASAPESYSVGEDRFRVLGKVRYEHSRVTLVDVPTKPGFAFGYTSSGVRFVMIAPLMKGRMIDLSNAAPGRQLQSAFDLAKIHLLPNRSDETMFACLRGGTTH